MAPPDLSIVVPAYNEALRIGPALAAIGEYVGGSGRACELIVVDDGSTDGTAERVRCSAPPALRFELLSTPANRGKGHAVRRGVLAARGERVLVTDADLSTPLSALEQLEAWLDRGCDVVIASRDLPDSRLDPPQPRARRWAAWAFRALRRRILLPDLRDTQCGFKLFSAPAARAIFTRATVDGWLFDCEILALAVQLGFRVREVGVTWRNHPDSRVRPLRVAVAAIPELLAIRRRVRRVQRAAPSEYDRRLD